MNCTAPIRILPVELLCEILSYLEVQESVKFAYMSGSMVLRNKILSIGGLKSVKMVVQMESSYISRVIQFSGMTTLEIDVCPQCRIDSDIGWVESLPGTLKHIRFRFAMSDFIWLRSLKPSVVYGPYPFLYEINGYVPISLKSQFPNLKSFEMSSGSSTVGQPLVISPNESTLRMPDSASSPGASIHWSYLMLTFFFNHLPRELHTLRSSLLHLIDVSLISLPKSLTRVHFNNHSVKTSPFIASLGTDIGESLIQLTWNASKESLSEIAIFAPHLRSLHILSPLNIPTTPMRVLIPQSSRHRLLTHPKTTSPISFSSGLRVLRLSSVHIPWIDETQALTFISALPKTLHTLELRYSNSFLFSSSLVSHLPSGLVSLILGDKLKLFDFTGLPSGLQHLSSGIASKKLNFPSLPSHLTRLECRTHQIWTVKASESLPRGLLRLKLEFGGLEKTSFPEHLILALPRGVVHLGVSPFSEWSYASVAALPRSLEVLKLETGATLSEEVLVALPRTLKRFGEPTIVVSASTVPLNTVHMDSESILKHVHALMPSGIAKRHQLRWKSNMWGWTAPNILQAVVIGVLSGVSLSSYACAPFVANSSYPLTSSGSTSAISTASQSEVRFELPPALTSLDLSEIPLSTNQERELLMTLPSSVTNLTSSVMCSAAVLAQLRHLNLPHLHSLSAFYQIYATNLPIDTIQPVQDSSWHLIELRLPHTNWLSFLDPPLTLEIFEVKHIESRLLTPLTSLQTLIQGTAQHSTSRMQDLPHSLTYLSISFPYLLVGPPNRHSSISSLGNGYPTQCGTPTVFSPHTSSQSSTHSSTQSSPLIPRMETEPPIGQRLLPPKLKSMLAPKSIVSRALFEALPRSVTFVKVGQLIVHDVKDMLIHLEEIGIQSLDFNALSGPPPASYIAPCTATVECGPWEMKANEEDIRNLPRGLKSLTMPQFFLMNCFISTLPSGLTYLDLRKLRPPISSNATKKLPRSLHTLIVDASSWTSDSISDLPSGLKHLHITTMKNFRRQHAQKLPRSLETLIVECRRIYDATIPYLPEHILHLAFPEAYEITIKGIALLPRSLRSLVLERLPDVHWKVLVDALPKSLAQLHPLDKSLISNTEFKKPENTSFWQEILS